MTEAEIWREKAREWCFQAHAGSDWYIAAMLKKLAADAAKLAGEIEREQACVVRP